jgi:hypothetical protein
MSKGIRLPVQDERLRAFARKLESLLAAKNWNKSDFAREATKHAPKGVTIGRHLTAAYCRGDNEPTPQNLTILAKTLGVQPEDLMPSKPGDGGRYATATSTIDGKTRLVVDAEVEPETAMKILTMLREDTKKK